MKSDKIGIFSFFAGAGFLDLGFEKTGLYETLFVNEYHKAFMDIYIASRKNLNIAPPKFGHHVCDITEFSTNFNSIWLAKNLEEAKNEYKHIGFIGGPPCPDFSVAGKNRGKEGENGKLSGTYIDLICSNKPDFFLFENVKGLYRTKKHREFFDSLKIKLNKSGYILTEKLINAIEFGAPQNRERIILIGFQKSMLTDSGLKTTETFNWDQDYQSKDVFSKAWPTKDDFSENSLLPNPLNIPVELSVEYWFNKNDVLNHPNASHYFTPRAGLSKFLIIPEGDDLKKSYKRLHRWRYFSNCGVWQ
jgi:DNA (cytosine-5)-methyltransferase 1